MYRRGLSCIAFVLLSLLFVNVHGQEREVPVSEILKKTQPAEALLRSIPYRSIMTSEAFQDRDAKPTGSGKLTLEQIPPSRYRSLQENNSPGSFKTMESISVAGRHYLRFDDQPWRQPPPPTMESPPPLQGPAAAAKPRWKFTVTGKLLERITLDNRNVDVYETHSIGVRADPEGETTHIVTNRYWLRDDGYLLKKVSEFEHKEKKTFNRTTVVYEYDNIRIEEPVIASEKGQPGR